MYGEDIKCSPLATTAAREPVAAEICKFASELAERAEKLASRVDGKLSPVATSARPQPVQGGGEACREYPPLFSELRSRFFSLANSLDSIEETISRVEL